jgi:hypothetical protein
MPRKSIDAAAGARPRVAYCGHFVAELRPTGRAVFTRGCVSAGDLRDREARQSAQNLRPARERREKTRAGSGADAR